MKTFLGALKSKTIWFNVIMLVIMGAGLIDSQFPLDPRILALILGFGNFGLRFITTGSLSDKMQ